MITFRSRKRNETKKISIKIQRLFSKQNSQMEFAGVSMRRSSQKIILLLVLLAASGARLLAQSSNATLSGFIHDSQGGAVPNAHVVVEQLSTHARREATTSDAGSYNIVDLPIGDYKVTATAQGFKIAVIPTLTLQTAQAANLDFSLSLGDVSEQVVVTTTPPQINTQESSIGQVVENKSIESVALNGRQFWQLVALTPGATYTPGGQGTRTGGSSLRSSSVNVQINGTGFIYNGWSLDGVDITEYEQGGTNVQPNVDSLAEFKVFGANMPASYGFTPNVVAATMKSGGNQFHGTAFEFIRNDAADARNYFATTNKNLLKRHQFGGAIGGPIRKDKIFFFSDFEMTKQSSGIVFKNSGLVLTDQERTGNFNDSSVAVFKDPTTGATLLPGNRFVTVSPQAAYFIQFMPRQSEANFSAAQKMTILKGDGKVDAVLTQRDHLVGRYSITDNDEEDPNQFKSLGVQALHSRAQNIALTETHTFGAKWLNEAKVALYKDIFLFGPVLAGTNYLANAGITGFEQTQLQPSFPYITITGGASFNGSGNGSLPKSNRIRTWQYGDTVTYSGGKHEVIMGFGLFHQRHTFFNGQGQEGIFAFSNKYTGVGLADFVSGYPATVTRAFPISLYGSIGNWYTGFIQDNWRIRPDLTLNIGLRYEHTPFYNSVNGQNSAFDYSTGKVIVPTRNGQIYDTNAQPEIPLLLPLFSDRLESSETLGLPESLRKSGPGMLAPRVGLAYRVGGKDAVVVRAAYGLFPIYFDSNMSLQWTKTVPFEVTQSVPNGSLPTYNFQNPFNGQPVVAPNTGGTACPGTTVVYASCLTPSVFTAPTKLQHTYMHQYNLAVQWQIANNLSMELAYVGNRTVHAQLISVPDNIPQAGVNTNLSIQARRPYPQWGQFSLGLTNGSASYNALQAKIEKRYSNGFQLLGSYAYSKCLDNGTSQSAPPSVSQYSLNYGVCDIDLRQVLTTSSVYALPFGRDRRFMNHSNAFVNGLLGGWELAGILTLRSGLPYTPVVGSDVALTGLSNQRPNRDGVPYQPRNPLCWLYDSANANCVKIYGTHQNVFKNADPNTYGTSGRNILFGDGLVQLDTTLKKVFQIHERLNTELRLEAFNVANHPTFSNPSATIGTGSTGSVTTTLNANRTLQAAIKINF
jgi:hypothetical protein